MSGDSSTTGGRRQFLQGAMGVLSVAAAHRALAAPCPPSQLTAAGGTSATTTCPAAQSSDLPTLTLTSAAGAGTYPWTFGQAFREGHVPNGTALSCDAEFSQVQVRNRWADGSVKFAVISGVSTFTGATKVVTVRLGAGTSGANVAEPATLDAVISFSGSVTGSYALQNALGVSKEAWNGRAGAGRVRQFLGPVMSEFHYYVPTSDAHVMVWFYVRRYLTGATEIETVIENGWLKIASPVEKSYGISASIGGSVRYSATIAHRHHSRWSRIDWIGTAPRITPKHDAAYLKSTKLVPNYANITVSETAFSTMVQTAAPMTRGNFDFAAQGGGYHSHLGILPHWEAAYVVSGDARAYNAMLANEQAGNCVRMSPSAGDGGFNYRDENTGLPINLVDHYNSSCSNGYSPNYGSGLVYLGSDSSGATWSTDQAHSWAGGYLAYLTTARWFSLETTQYLAGAEFLQWGISSGTNDGQRWMTGEDRACAWTMRTLACAAVITPDSQTTLRNGYITHLQAAWAKWRSNEVDFNTLGIRRHVYNYTDYAPAPYLSCGAFQQFFIAQAFAFGYEIASGLLSATAKTQWRESAQFHATFAVGLLGTGSDYCFRRAGQYALAIGPNRANTDGFYGSWTEVYAANVAIGTIPAGETCNTGSTLEGGSIPDASSYWGNLHPAAAYARDIGASGASTAWSRLIGASNYGSLYADFSNYPHFAVVAR